MDKQTFFGKIDKMYVREIQNVLGVSSQAARELKKGNSVRIDAEKLLAFNSYR